MSNRERNETELNKPVELFVQTQTVMQTQAPRSVDTAPLVRNWLFGGYIVEFENAGAELVIFMARSF